MGIPGNEAELSSIPDSAIERVIARYSSGAKKQADYFVNDATVGRRWFYEAGQREMEIAYLNGRQHGRMQEWYASGQISSATAYADGQEHGIARQWAEDGTLVGSYELDHGTGLDLWWQARFDMPGWYLAEARNLLAGYRHGFEWWVNENQRRVDRESHFAHGREHGIFRDWNSAGRLRRGFPKYFVNGARVSKCQYLRAALADNSLPAFRDVDNRPERQFPSDVAALRPA